MELITWTSNLNTGFDKVDKQHHHMVNLINSLYEHVQTNQSGDQIKTILLELYGYSVNHFSMEETLMLKAGYLLYNDHKREHNQFVSKIDDFRALFMKGEKKIDVELVFFLKGWFIDHVIGTDKKTFATILEKRD